MAKTQEQEKTLDEQIQDARIVACVNACEGLNPEAIPELVALFGGVLESMAKAQSIMDGGGKWLDASIWLTNTAANIHDALDKAVQL